MLFETSMHVIIVLKCYIKTSLLLLHGFILKNLQHYPVQLLQKKSKQKFILTAKHGKERYVDE